MCNFKSLLAFILSVTHILAADNEPGTYGPCGINTNSSSYFNGNGHVHMCLEKPFKVEIKNDDGHVMTFELPTKATSVKGSKQQDNNTPLTTFTLDLEYSGIEIVQKNGSAKLTSAEIKFEMAYGSDIEKYNQSAG